MTEPDSVPEPPMPTLEIPAATYERLALRAAKLQTSVEELAVPALERVAIEPMTDVPPQSDSPVDLPYDKWKKALDEIVARAQARAHLYPPGFEADVSRESIYEGCGE